MRIKSKVAAAESAFHWQKWQATANKEKGKQARRGHHDVVPLRCDHTETITPPAWTAETLASASATGERQPRGRASRCSAARGRGAGQSQTQRASSCRAAAECVCLRVRREAFLLLRGHELSHGLIGIAPWARCLFEARLAWRKGTPTLDSTQPMEDSIRRNYILRCRFFTIESI
jgi:hypothetical protein